MPKIPERNKRFRTKEQIVCDIVHVLNAEVAYGTKYAVLKDASWVWTEFHGKYNGCKWWSKKALRLKKQDPKTRLLRHEHAVPRKVVFAMLCKLRNPSVKSVGRICNKFLIGVVVTKEEESLLNRRFNCTMPEDFGNSKSKDYRKPWLRYDRCKIKLASTVRR